MKRRDYIPSPAPTAPSGSQQLVEWLIREFNGIRAAFSGVYDMPVTTKPPTSVTEGMLRYADGTEWNPGSGKGVYIYNGTAWVKL
jgi:hypothetical protein